MRVQLRHTLFACALGAVTGWPVTAVHAEPPASAASAASPERGQEVIIVEDETVGTRQGLDGMATAARARAATLAQAQAISVIYVDERGNEGATLADLLAELPGVRLSQLGGWGSYAALSVRGAAPGHTTVQVDGVPASRMAGATLDIARYDVDGFAEVEVMRGASPGGAEATGVGGQLNLCSRIGPGAGGEVWAVAMGMGALGARDLRLRWGDVLAPDRAAMITLGASASDGEFDYFSNGGTLLNPDDDGLARRQHNGFVQVDGSARLRAGALEAGVRAQGKQQELAGVSTAGPADASLATATVTADARYGWQRRAQAWTVLGHVTGEQQTYRDPLDQIGLGAQANRYRLLAGAMRAGWTGRVGGWASEAHVELRGEHFRDVDVRTGVAGIAGDRGGVALGLQATRAVGWLEVTPSMRLDAALTRPIGEPGLFMDAIAEDARVAVSPRLALLGRPHPDIALKANAGRYARQPTVAELFGDRGFVVGNPSLRAETGWSGDVGAVWMPARAHGAWDRVALELTGFASRAHDSIQVSSATGVVARAINVGGAQVYGLEAAAGVRVARRLMVRTAYTALRSQQRSVDVNYDGDRLPRQPSHAVSARAEWAGRWAARPWSIWLGAEAQSGAYLDQANLRWVPGRALLDVGGKLGLPGGWRLGLAVGNLLDLRTRELTLDGAPGAPTQTAPVAVADVAGFPLPGRTWFLSVGWSR